MYNSTVERDSPNKPKSAISRIANFHGFILELRILSILSIQQQKSYIDCFTYASEILHSQKVKNQSFDITEKRDHYLVCLHLEIFFAISNNEDTSLSLQVYFFVFLMYIVSVGKYTFMMISNQMTDILWENAASNLNIYLCSNFISLRKGCNEEEI